MVDTLLSNNFSNEVYETLSVAVNDLIRRVMFFNFNIKSNGIECVENSINIEPDELNIDKN